MLSSERILGATGWVIVTMLAATATFAADYRQPNFAIPIEDASGRVTGGVDRVDTDPMNQVQPIVSEILFLDSHRSLVFFPGGAKNPSLVLTNHARQEVSTVELGELKNYHPRQALLAGFRVGTGTGLTAVVLQVANYGSNGGVAYGSTVVVVFVFDQEGLISRSAPIKVEDQDYTSSGGMPNPTWYFLTADSIESGERNPGVMSFARVFLRDVNGDGYDDVVLWRKNLSSLPAEAPPRLSNGGIDRYFERKPDDAQVMTFDPASRTFSAPKLGERLPTPAEALWDKVPNLRYRTK